MFKNYKIQMTRDDYKLQMVMALELMEKLYFIFFACREKRLYMINNSAYVYTLYITYTRPIICQVQLRGSYNDPSEQVCNFLEEYEIYFHIKKIPAHKRNNKMYPIILVIVSEKNCLSSQVQTFIFKNILLYYLVRSLDCF